MKLHVKVLRYESQLFMQVKRMSRPEYTGKIVNDTEKKPLMKTFLYITVSTFRSVNVKRKKRKTSTRSSLYNFWGFRCKIFNDLRNSIYM